MNRIPSQKVKIACIVYIKYVYAFGAYSHTYRSCLARTIMNFVVTISLLLFFICDWIWENLPNRWLSQNLIF